MVQKMTREDWNLIYAGGDFDYNREPNRHLVYALSLLRERGVTRGMLLDCAMGEGRNAIYAALQGFTVHGFDISDEALNRAQERAAHLGLKIHTYPCETDDYDYGKARWDVILVLFYPAIRRIMDQIKQALKPGGYLILASPMAGMEQLVPDAHPDILDNLYEPGELAHTFHDYEIVFNSETVDWMDFFRVCKLPMVEFIARKPLPGETV